MSCSLKIRHVPPSFSLLTLDRSVDLQVSLERLELEGAQQHRNGRYSVKESWFQGGIAREWKLIVVDHQK